SGWTMTSPEPADERQRRADIPHGRRSADGYDRVDDSKPSELRSMATPTLDPRQGRDRRRWDTFGPFAVSALIVSIAAVLIAFSAAQSSDADATLAGHSGHDAALDTSVVATPSERLKL